MASSKDRKANLRILRRSILLLLHIEISKAVLIGQIKQLTLNYWKGGKKMITHFSSCERAHFFIICIFSILLILMPTGLKAQEPYVRITFVDFQPEHGNFDVNWPGPPRRAWTEADKKYYKARIELLEPAPCTITFFFWIKGDRTLWFDYNLGFFSATFPMGERIATPRFWLVCTKAGKVKGCDGKNGNCARVYLEPVDLARTDCPIYWENKAKRYTHSICCK